jgi:hypothetical protein
VNGSDLLGWRVVDPLLIGSVRGDERTVMFNAEVGVILGAKRVLVSLEKSTKFHDLWKEVYGGENFVEVNR